MSFLKRLFCRHTAGAIFVRNLYGDEINEYGGMRSVWRCKRCDARLADLNCMPQLDQPKGAIMSIDVCTCAACKLASKAIAIERDTWRAEALRLRDTRQWKPLAQSLLFSLGEISDKLGISEDERATATGNEEILDRIDEMRAATAPTATYRQAVLGAVERGWRAEANRGKEMDSELALAIAEEVLALTPSGER
jgi:hypothetical protein